MRAKKKELHLERKAQRKKQDPIAKNHVEVVGLVASATLSRDGILSRRIEVPIPGARESLDVECEKGQFSPLFRSLKVGQWICLQGAVRKRFWRTGANISSRSYIQLHSLKSISNRPPSTSKTR